MKKLYYATFEKGYEEIVKQYLKKLDRANQVKKMYEGAVLFFAENTKMENTDCFHSLFTVIHNSEKQGVGGINQEMKLILEKKDLKISLPKEIRAIRLVYKKENEKVLVDNALKKAFEVKLAKTSKKQISYFNGEVDFVILAKEDGTILFMRKEYEMVEKTRFSLSASESFFINFLSEPVASEVVLDAFAGAGELVYSRCKNFKKANVIANAETKEDAEALKKLARKLKDNKFSVLSYNFLEDNFPIKFIDKIVTYLPTNFANNGAVYHEFFEKTKSLNVKTMVVVCSKSYDASKYFAGKYEILAEVVTRNYFVYKIKLI